MTRIELIAVPLGTQAAASVQDVPQDDGFAQILGAAEALPDSAEPSLAALPVQTQAVPPPLTPQVAPQPLLPDLPSEADFAEAELALLATAAQADGLDLPETLEGSETQAEITEAPATAPATGEPPVAVAQPPVALPLPAMAPPDVTPPTEEAKSTPLPADSSAAPDQAPIAPQAAQVAVLAVPLPPSPPPSSPPAPSEERITRAAPIAPTPVLPTLVRTAPDTLPQAGAASLAPRLGESPSQAARQAYGSATVPLVDAPLPASPGQVSTVQSFAPASLGEAVVLLRSQTPPPAALTDLPSQLPLTEALPDIAAPSPNLAPPAAPPEGAEEAAPTPQLPAPPQAKGADPALPQIRHETGEAPTPSVGKPQIRLAPEPEVPTTPIAVSKAPSAAPALTEPAPPRSAPAVAPQVAQADAAPFVELAPAAQEQTRQPLDRGLAPLPLPQGPVAGPAQTLAQTARPAPRVDELPPQAQVLAGESAPRPSLPPKPDAPPPIPLAPQAAAVVPQESGEGPPVTAKPEPLPPLQVEAAPVAPEAARPEETLAQPIAADPPAADAAPRPPVSPERQIAATPAQAAPARMAEPQTRLRPLPSQPSPPSVPAEPPPRGAEMLRLLQALRQDVASSPPSDSRAAPVAEPRPSVAPPATLPLQTPVEPRVLTLAAPLTEAPVVPTEAAPQAIARPPSLDPQTPPEPVRPAPPATGASPQASVANPALLASPQNAAPLLASALQQPVLQQPVLQQLVAERPQAVVEPRRSPSRAERVIPAVLGAEVMPRSDAASLRPVAEPLQAPPPTRNPGKPAVAVETAQPNAVQPQPPLPDKPVEPVPTTPTILPDQPETGQIHAPTAAPASSSQTSGLQASAALAATQAASAETLRMAEAAADFAPKLVRRIAETGERRSEIVLEPAELGKLRFELVTKGDKVEVNLTAERPETLDLLRSHVAELRQEFRAAGLDAGAMNFGQWGQGARDERGFAPMIAEGGEGDFEASVPPLTPLPPERRSVAGGLDLRL